MVWFFFLFGGFYHVPRRLIYFIGWVQIGSDTGFHIYHHHLFIHCDHFFFFFWNLSDPLIQEFFDCILACCVLYGYGQAFFQRSRVPLWDRYNYSKRRSISTSTFTSYCTTCIIIFLGSSLLLVYYGNRRVILCEFIFLVATYLCFPRDPRLFCFWVYKVMFT